MFFALSKILPLLVYPIGFACSAMLVGFILAWRRSRWTPLPIALAFTVLLLASNAAVSDTLVRSLEWRYLPPDPVPEADAIVLLGGLTERGQPPRPGVELNEEGDRALYAAELYLAGKAPVLLVSGGPLGLLVTAGGGRHHEDLAQTRGATRGDGSGAALGEYLRKRHI